MKKSTSIVVAILLTLSMLLAACGGSGNNTVTEAPATTAATTAAATTAAATTTEAADEGPEPITFTMYMEDVAANRTEENFQGMVSKKITEDTGVTVKYNFGVGDVSEQITLMIADRSYPDFVFSRSHLYNFLEADAYIDLAPLIDKYGANIKKHYGDSLEGFKDDAGHIYYVGQGFVNIVLEDPEDAFEIQHAVLKEQGYPKMRTLDNLSDAIREYKDKHPTIDGQPTIGITLCCAEGWRYYITLINPGLRAIGCPDDGNFYVDPDTYRVTYAYTIPEIKDYYLWLNGLYNEGLLDPDSFTQTYDEYLAKVASGRVLALTDAIWEYDEAESVLIGEGKDERTYARFPLTLDEKYLHPAYRLAAYAPLNGVGITDNCPDPVRAIQFLDYLCQEETQILTNWGLEGVHWEIRDGRRSWTAAEAAARGTTEHAIETAIGMMTYPWPSIGAALDSKGYKFSPLDDDEAIIDGYNPEAKATLAAYGGTTWKSLYPPPSAFRPSEWGQAWYIWDNQPPDSEFSLLMNECYDLTAQYLPIVCSAKAEEFDDKWEEFMVRLNEKDLDRFHDLATELLKANFWVVWEGEDED